MGTTIQYASLEEAWGNSSVTQQYPVDDGFEVSKSDVRQQAPYAGLEDDVTMALESAYPVKHETASRMARTPKRIAHHSRNGTPCAMADSNNASFAPQYNAISEGVEEHAKHIVPDSHSDDAMRGYYRTDSAHHDAPSTMHTTGPHTAVTHNIEVPNTSYHSTSSSERVALYDILIFVLFGLLIVLALHEAANLGELIGRTVR